MGEDVDLANNFVSVELDELSSGASRVGISTQGTIVSIREDSGIIYRCTECRRVLRDGECAIHGAQDGNMDVRLRWFLTMVNRQFPSLSTNLQPNHCLE